MKLALARLARPVADAAAAAMAAAVVAMAAVAVAVATVVAAEATAAAEAAVDVATAAVATGAADKPARSRAKLLQDGGTDPVGYSRTSRSLRAGSLLAASQTPPDR